LEGENGEIPSAEAIEIYQRNRRRRIREIYDLSEET
jgi:hypothetical protein